MKDVATGHCMPSSVNVLDDLSSREPAQLALEADELDERLKIDVCDVTPRLAGARWLRTDDMLSSSSEVGSD